MTFSQTFSQLRRSSIEKMEVRASGRESANTTGTSISISNLQKHFPHQSDQVEVLSNLSFSLGPGENGSIIGPSGCGKSTLLRIIAGLEQYDSGEVVVHGLPVTGTRRDIGFMFQGLALLPWRTVISNVRLPGELIGLPKAELNERASKCLDIVGLSAYSRYPLRQISGGMRQRVALARLLMTDTKLLLLDEPFSSLDEFTREAIDLLFMRVAEDTKSSYLMVTHSIPEAVLMSDKIFVLSPAPARLLSVVDVTLPRPRTKTMQDEPSFHNIMREVREVLLPHVV